MAEQVAVNHQGGSSNLSLFAPSRKGGILTFYHWVWSVRFRQKKDTPFTGE